MSRVDLLAALAALAAALLLEPVGAALGDRNVALLAALALTAPAAAVVARRGWATPVVAQILGWTVILATASPVRIEAGAGEVSIVREGLSLSPWLALVSPLSLGLGMGCAAYLRFLRTRPRSGGSKYQSPFTRRS